MNHIRFIRLNNFPDRLLEPLRRLWREHGYISHRLIEITKGIPSPQTYPKRFGTLRDTYKRIGYIEQPDRERLKHYARTRKIVIGIAKKLCSAVEKNGSAPVWNWQRRSLAFGPGEQLRITTARYLPTRQSRKRRWEFEINSSLRHYLLLVIRLDEQHAAVLDYFLLPPYVPLKRLNFIDDRNTFNEFRCPNLRSTIACAIKGFTV